MSKSDHVYSQVSTITCMYQCQCKIQFCYYLCQWTPIATCYRRIPYYA